MTLTQSYFVSKHIINSNSQFVKNNLNGSNLRNSVNYKDTKKEDLTLKCHVYQYRKSKKIFMLFLHPEVGDTCIFHRVSTGLSTKDETVSVKTTLNS